MMKSLMMSHASAPLPETPNDSSPPGGREMPDCTARL